MGGLQDPWRARNYGTLHSWLSGSTPSCRAFFMSWPLVLLDLEYADLDWIDQDYDFLCMVYLLVNVSTQYA